MNKKLILLLSCFMAALLVVAAGIQPGIGKEPEGRRLQKTAGTDVLDTDLFDVNRLYNYFNNRGAWGTANSPLGWACEWPGQSGHPINYASGIWFGGKVNNTLRTACAEYSFEFQPGPVLPNGSAADPNDPIHQAYNIKKGDLLDEGFSNPDYDLWINEGYKYGAPIERDENGNPILSASGKRIPAIIGDQMAWMAYNDFNAGNHAAVFGSQPMGLEVQNTIWAFNRPDAFGDMLFMKFLAVNKGGNTIDSTYVGVWFDIDLGDSNDDLVFCDTTLSLAGFWNDGSDTNFDPAPAVGADFFQGPIVPSPGDTAYVSGRPIPDYKNLGMTSFAKYVRGGNPNQQDPETAKEAYNFMKGFDGFGDVVLDDQGNPTAFVNVSDPEAGTGWVDGVIDAPADRRMLMNSGPFTLEPWVDTNGNGFADAGEPGVQEIVVGFLLAQGTNAKNSVTQLKRADQSAQLAFDIDFQLPPPPPVPKTTISNMDGEVVISWEGNAETYVEEDQVIRDADGNPTSYTFQGYNVYQVDAPVVGPNTGIIKIATFDVTDGVGDIQDQVFSNEFGEQVLATIQRAPDTGLQRFIRVTNDALNGGVPIRNWQTFWYVVTAYGYNPDGIPKILESPFQSIAIQPQPKPGGLTAQREFGDIIAEFSADTTLNAAHTSSGLLSNGEIQVKVVDPSVVTGQDYTVTFEVNDDGETVWNLDRADGTNLLSGQTNQTGDEGYSITDGLMVKVLGPPLQFDQIIEVAYADTVVEADNVLHSLNSRGTYFITTNGTGEDAGDRSRLERYISVAVPYDYEIRFTATGGYGVWAFDDDKVCTTPFELWNIGINTPDDPSDDYRMIPFILLDADSTVSAWRADAGNTEPWFGGAYPASDVIYWMDPEDASPGDAGYKQFEAVAMATGAGNIYPSASDGSRDGYFADFHGGFVYPIGRFVYSDFAGTGTAPPAGTTVRMVTTKPNGPADQFTFSSSGSEALVNATAAAEDLENINVFPNPYLGQNRAEITPVNRFVTFTHLPPDVNDLVIRVFTLAGDLVAVIDQADRESDGTSGTQTATWDLRNEESVPVASGMYIAHIDMGAKGSKVLKLAIFAPEERLDKF